MSNITVTHIAIRPSLFTGGKIEVKDLRTSKRRLRSHRWVLKRLGRGTLAVLPHAARALWEAA